MTTITRTIQNYNTIEYAEKSIYIIENIFDDEFCDELRKAIDILPLRKNMYGYSQNVKCFITDESILKKISDTLYYEFSTDDHDVSRLLAKIKSPTESIYTNDLNGLSKSFVGDLFAKIESRIEMVKSIFQELNPKLVFEYNSGFMLRKIYGPTRNHCDGPQSGINRNSSLKFINERDTDKLNVQYIRNSSCIFTLNDDYEESEFFFSYHNVKLRLKKGSLVCFPPYWSHPHEVSEPTNNTYRYTVSTWFCEKHIPM
jgi:hypothetical protein